MGTLRFAVVLSGAGFKDGSEIHESVHLLTAIARHGAQYQCFAPEMEQHDVVDHQTGTQLLERRGVLREAARIARGDIKPLREYRAGDYDGLLMPGGYGAAKNLSTYALAGEGMTVQEEVRRAVLETHQAGKPLGALCIAPMILARLLPGVTITLGPSGGASEVAARLGATVREMGCRDVCVDEARRVYSTPCYMHPAGIVDVAEGIDALVRAMVESLRA